MPCPSSPSPRDARSFPLLSAWPTKLGLAVSTLRFPPSVPVSTLPLTSKQPMLGTLTRSSHHLTVEAGNRPAVTAGAGGRLRIPMEQASGGSRSVSTAATSAGAGAS